MALATMPADPGGWLKWEQENLYSREEVTILSGQVLVSGEVVAIVTASGKYVAFDQDGADGSEDAAGVILLAQADVGADVAATIIRRQAIVNRAGLTFPSDITGGEQTAAEAELIALGILVREGA